MQLPKYPWVGKVIHIQFPPDQLHIGLIQCSDAEAAASWSTTEGTLRVCCSYCGTPVTIPVTVAVVCHRSIFKDTLTYSTLSSAVSYEIYAAGQRKSNEPHFITVEIILSLKLKINLFVCLFLLYTGSKIQREI